MQTLKRSWNEDWRATFQHFSLRDPRPILVEAEARTPPLAVEQLATIEPPPAGTASASEGPGAGNIVRPSFPKLLTAEAPGRERPDLSAALDVVMKAAELIKAAEDRASQAERQAASLALRSCAQLEAMEGQLKAAEDEIRAADEKARATERFASEQVRTAEAQTSAAWARVLELKAELEAANTRLFAAETTIAEAREDMQYLLNHVRDQIGAAIR